MLGGGFAVSALAFLTDLAVLIPAGAAAIAAYSLGSARAARGGSSLDHDLMKRRRREEPAAMLVVEGRYAASAGPALGTSLRVTDSVDWKMRRGQVRLRAILDEEGLDRSTVERRLAEASGGALRAGWATFPEDGFTVHALEEAARARMIPIDEAHTADEALVLPAVLAPVEQGAGQ